MSADDTNDPNEREPLPAPEPEPTPFDEDGEPASMRRPGAKAPPSARVAPAEPAASEGVTSADASDAPAAPPEVADEPATSSDDEAPYRPITEPPIEGAASAAPPVVEPSPPSLRPLSALAPESRRPPAISNLKPDKASIDGGTRVTLFGAGFQEGCYVFVENVAIATEWVDANCVRFVAPEHPEGLAHLELENPDGLRSRTLVSLAFERGPVVLDLQPYESPPEGGVVISIEGEGFRDGCTVSLFGVHAPAVTFESDKLLRFVAPPVGEGPYEGPLTITNPDGLACRIEHSIVYRALAPCIDAIEPNHAWVNGGKAIEVRGADFHASCRVRFADRPAEVRFKSATLLEVVVPEGAEIGTVDVHVENPGGATTTLATGFRYEPVPAPPKIISLLPANGATTGGQVIRVSGDNFTETTRLRFGEVTAVTRFVSAKIVDAELPPRTLPGLVAVEAVDGGVTVRVEDAFTYFSPKAPKITGLEPMSGPQTGGTKIVIEGEGFPANATVRLGREAPKHVAIKGASRIEIVAPPAKQAGFADLEITSPETGPGVMKNAFRYDAVPPPTVTSVAPNRGTTNGGTELTVEGKNFAEGATVMIGKKAAKRVKRVSGSILEVVTPDGDDGAMVDVVVKNPDGREAVQKRAFQYDARYRA